MPRPRDPRPFLIGGGAAVAVLLLLVLFIGPCSILNPSDDGDEAVFNCPTVKSPPAPPDGLELSSEVKDFSDGKCNKTVPGGPAAITLPLEKGRGARGLAFYTFSGDRWQRVAPAELTDDGKSARVVVDRVPSNGGIMRRAADTFQIMAVVPSGQQLREDAERLATVVGGEDFVPAADGAVNGNVSNIKRNDAALLVPVVRGSGGAGAEAVRAIVGSPEARAAHAAALARQVQANRLDGIELQYTDVAPEQRADFTDLVKQAADSVHRGGGLLILTLPLPARDGNNWNTGAYDWNQLGKLADYIKIAPERDQSVYRKEVPEALTYLTGQVEPKKLVLTISPLSVEKSDQGMRVMSTLEALSIASQFTVRDRERAAANADVILSADNLNQEAGGAGGLNWDAVAATVSFTYQSGDAPRTIWIENQYSVAFKAELAMMWGLGGVAVDDASANEGLVNIWPAIEPLAAKQTPPLLQPNSSLLRPEWQVDNRPFQAGRAVVTWKAPAEGGTHRITLIVSDGQMRVSSSTQLTLRPAPPPVSGSPTPTTTPAAAPRPPGAAAPTATPTVRR